MNLRSRSSLSTILLVAVASALVMLCTSPQPVDGATKQRPLHERYKNLCGASTKISRKHEKQLRWLVQNVGDGALTLSTSPQHEAACWMIRENKWSVQRFVLGAFYYGTKGLNWDINTDWMTHKHECSWYGVKCNGFKKVTGLDLGFIKVDGIIPREIGLLTGLEDLDLHGNDLQGVIPHKLMAGLRNLKYLRLHMNGMFGGKFTAHIFCTRWMVNRFDMN